MNLKLIMAIVDDGKTEAIMNAAREAGATGATVITSSRGEGIRPERTFLGLDFTGHRDVLLFLVADTRAREILETIGRVGRFDDEPGTGIAFQIATDDAVGLKSQASTLRQEIEETL